MNLLWIVAGYIVGVALTYSLLEYFGRKYYGTDLGNVKILVSKWVTSETTHLFIEPVRKDFCRVAILWFIYGISDLLDFLTGRRQTMFVPRYHSEN